MMVSLSLLIPVRRAVSEILRFQLHTHRLVNTTHVIPWLQGRHFRLKAALEGVRCNCAQASWQGINLQPAPRHVHQSFISSGHSSCYSSVAGKILTHSANKSSDGHKHWWLAVSLTPKGSLLPHTSLLLDLDTSLTMWDGKPVFLMLF